LFSRTGSFPAGSFYMKKFIYAGMKKAEEGQALTEMAVMLIAVMVVFLGLIFAYAIGKKNISSMIDCYGKAGDNAYNNVYDNPGTQILTWSAGPDERMYTNDDVPVTGGDDNPQLFRDQFISNDGKVDLNGSFHPEYIKENFVPHITAGSSIFHTAANLTSASESYDIYEIKEVNDLKEAFSYLIFSSDVIVENSAFMPMLRPVDAPAVSDSD
jgi:uncharacterized protein (UPF0333 family)